MNWNLPLPYFTAGELACRCCGLIKLDIRFASQLPALREAWGRKLNPTSICRCPKHNANEGGHPNSLHLTDNPKHPTNGTMAADFSWRAWHSKDQLKFAQLAWSLGWSVGLHDGFCHIDRRIDINLPQIVYLYGPWTGKFDAGTVTHGV